MYKGDCVCRKLNKCVDGGVGVMELMTLFILFYVCRIRCQAERSQGLARVTEVALRKFCNLISCVIWAPSLCCAYDATMAKACPWHRRDGRRLLMGVTVGWMCACGCYVHAMVVTLVIQSESTFVKLVRLSKSFSDHINGVEPKPQF